MTTKPRGRKPAAPTRLSAHARLCLDLGVERLPIAHAVDAIVRRLKRLKVTPLPERLGNGYTAEQIWNELRARANRKRQSRAKRSSGSMDRFVIHAWPRISPETRARLLASDTDDALRGDIAAREFARSTRDLFANPQDFQSFIDELSRL